MSRDLVSKEQKLYVTNEKEVQNLRYFVWFEATEMDKNLAVRAYQFSLSVYGDYNGF
ncbi:MAG: hypothetical protein WC209_04815 [Ignavibacteriaceae bacterium]|jgi:hypothetical protein